MATTKIPTTAQSTAGIVVSYALGTTVGVKPTSGWTGIGGITDYPEIGGAADSFETTTIDEDYMKTYVLGLIDPGGSQTVTYNFNKQTIDQIALIIAAQKLGTEIWIKMEIPAPASVDITYTAQFSPVAAPAVAINGVLQGTISMTYTGNFEMEAV